jgi:hypothetical protein
MPSVPCFLIIFNDFNIYILTLQLYIYNITSHYYFFGNCLPEDRQ